MVVKGKLQVSIARKRPFADANEAIRGRRIWMSGGVGGLGREFARMFLRHGCLALALTDMVDQAAGEQVVKELLTETPPNSRQKVRYSQVDVRDVWAVKEDMLDAAAKFGGLDTVINNAGVADEREINWTIEVNLVAVITATETALAVFDQVSDGGVEDRVIVNMGSGGGVFAIAIAPCYAASKHGVVGYTKSMRNACWERGVRINCFCPGWTSVGMGKTVSRGGQTAKFTGIMDKETVSKALVEIFRRRDIVGEAVYVSETAGPRLVNTSIETRLPEARFAKM